MADLILIISVAIRMMEQSPYAFSGASPRASLFEKFKDENSDGFDVNTVGEEGCTDENDITIIVSGILPSTSQYAVENYFENSRRSGGGKVSNVHYIGDGEVKITFLAVVGMCVSAFWLSVYVRSVLCFTAKRLSKSKHSLE